jgi:hypothetical protein
VRTNLAPTASGRSTAGVRFVRAAVAVGLVLGSVFIATPAQAYSLSDWTASLRSRASALRVPGSAITAAMPGGSSDPSVSVRRIAGVQRSAAAGARGMTLVPADAITSVTDPLSPRKAGVKALGAAGTALTAAYGVDLVYQGATAGFSYLGWFGADASSGSIVCDVQSLIGDASCALGPLPEYVVNGDVPAWAPGWADGVNTLTVETRGGGAFGGTYPVSTMTVIAEIQHAGNALTGTLTPTRAFNPDAAPYGESGYVNAGWSVAVHPDTGGAGGSGVYNIANNAQILSTAMGEEQPYSVVITDGKGIIGAGHAITYYSPTHPLRPADQDADPARTWVTTFECADGSGGSVTGDPWRESAPEWPGPLSPSCTAGGLTYVLVEQTSPGLDPWTLYEWRAPDALGDYAAAYPQCADAACVLELHRVDAATGTRVACFDQPDACAAWFEDPARSTSYVCTYGGADVALSECYAYAPTFDAARRTATGPAYADPATGAAPAPGGVTPPAAGCGNAPAFEFTLGGIGYWIAHGTAWALCEAFVPQPIAWPDLSGKTPVPQVGSAVTMLTGLDDVNARCIAIDIDAPMGAGKLHAFDSCGDDPAVRWLRSNRPITGAVMWVVMAAPLAWWAWRTYAPGAGGTT